MRLALPLAACLIATPAFAQDDFSANLKARQGQFRILALNLGILGGMAKGEIAYDAETAQMAADSIHAVSMVKQSPMTLWPEGTDEMAIDGTRALPAIWENWDDFASKWSALGEAAAGLQSAAANGQEAIGPAIGPLGNACKACHDDYRASQN